MNAGFLHVLLVGGDAEELSAVAESVAASRVPHRLLLASDASAALEALRSVPPHSRRIVIVDERSPNIEPLRLLGSIREDPQVSHVPVVVFTEEEDQESCRKLHQQAVSGCFPMPTSRHDQADLLDTTLRYWLAAQHAH